MCFGAGYWQTYWANAPLGAPHPFGGFGQSIFVSRLLSPSQTFFRGFYPSAADHDSCVAILCRHFQNIKVLH
jgi:hypothetical protein